MEDTHIRLSPNLWELTCPITFVEMFPTIHCKALIMSRECVVDDRMILCRDSSGNVLLEAPLLDLYYLIIHVLGSSLESTTRIDQFKAVAERLNVEYGCQLTFGKAMQLYQSIQDEWEDVKKNGFGEINSSREPEVSTPIEST